MFEVSQQDGKARTGTLQTQHGTISTPASLLYSRRGGVLNLTPDMLERLGPLANGVLVDALQFVASPDPATITEHGGGVHGFTALGSHVIFAGARDPFTWEYGAKGTSDGMLSVSLHNGTVKLTPDLYMGVMAALQPDVMVSMCDEVAADARTTRLAKSVFRTSSWLAACAQLKEQQQVTGQLWAAVTGGASAELRCHSAEAARKQEGVAGFWLCGFGTGESREARRDCLAAVMEKLGGGLPRGMTGAGSPLEVLEAVALGVDVFDGAYPVVVTLAGHALTFPVNPGITTAHGDAAAAAEDGVANGSGKGGLQGAGHSAGAAAAADTVDGLDCGGTDSKINLWAMQYVRDKRPLLPGCTCFTCSQGYTRAYIHHLLDAHELLAGVLLEMHNTHHWMQFFDAMRAAIAGRRFEEYRRALQQQKEEAISQL